MCIPGRPQVRRPAYRTSEHSASWHEAVLQVQSVLKGPKLKRNKIVLRFRSPATWPGSVPPSSSPASKESSFLQKEDVSGRPATSAPPKADVYTCCGPAILFP